MAAKREDQGKLTAKPGPQEQLASEERALGAASPSSRDPATREELVRRYLPFAKNLALRYRGASESFDDLLQVASLGLVNAIDRFDPERGTPFTAFASPTILGELKRHFRDRVWTVRVPRGLHDRMAEVEKAITELTVELQRSPSVGEIADSSSSTPTDVLEVLEANHNRRPLSLDRPVGGERGRIARLGVGRRRGRGLRAGRGQAGARGRPSPTSTSASAWSCGCASSRT